MCSADFSMKHVMLTLAWLLFHILYTCDNRIVNSISTHILFFHRYNWVSFRVVVGDTDTNITEGSEQEIAIASVHKHKGYVAGAHSNDIALIKLQHPVDLSSPNVNLACLPIFGERSFTPADTCYVAGWGQTKGKS